MGKEQSKIENPKANVVNEVEVTETNDSPSLQFLLWIIIVLMSLQIGLKIYLLHKKSLKRRYLTRATDLAQI